MVVNDPLASEEALTPFRAEQDEYVTLPEDWPGVPWPSSPRSKYKWKVLKLPR